MSEKDVDSAVAEATENNGNTQANEEIDVVEILPGFTNFDDFVTAGFNSMRAGIKAANNLPSGQNYGYYKCFPSFKNIMNGEMKGVLECMQNVIELAGVRGNIRRRDIEEKFELLLEANDILLDRAGICMDEASGIVRNPGVELIVSQTNTNNVSGSWNTSTSLPDHRPKETAEREKAIRLLAAKNVQRPQLMFKDKIDNSLKLWQPRIKDKPNSLKPLALFLNETEDGEAFVHPYEFELNKFEPSEQQLQKSEPIKYKPLADTSLIIIEKPEDIGILLADLKNYDEIAVDLEHHSYRSFQGITCLMQISTRDTDYLIDTLTLRSELHELNEIFTKPSILKVFHGADSDILWLQRDLSLYVVNMFDTYQAAKQLNLPYRSLAFLLKKYCGVDPNKHFQLADWRIRPLPEELMKYAREDTHYLLYIKDMLRNALIERANGQSNILKAVYDQSTIVCLKTYKKPVWTEDSHMDIYRKSRKMFNNKQLYALKELYKWRDFTAREEDDSTGYVLPNHMLLNIAESLPRELQGILACCNPIPPLVRQNLLKLHKIVLKAREQPLIKPVLEEDIRQRMAQRNQAANLETSWLYSPHDMPSGMEARADLPCLLDSNLQTNLSEQVSLADDEVDHDITVFDSPVSEDGGKARRKTSKKKKKTTFVSPFERYKRVLPMVAAEEAKEREMQAKEEAERLRVLVDEKKETASSINRVYEHFKKVTTGIKPEVDSDISELNMPTPAQILECDGKPGKMALSQMHGRKRKRQSNIDDVDIIPAKSEPNLSTTIPSLGVKMFQGFKREQQTEDPREHQISNPSGCGETGKDEKFKALRCVKKAEKKANKRNLKANGMMPAAEFNYREVDFSSFQGGSRRDGLSAPFDGQNKKKNIRPNRGKGNKRKKQRRNIR